MSDEFDLDDFGGDGDMDSFGDDLSFDSGEVADDRSPITAAASTAMDELMSKESAMRMSAKTVKTALPKGYNSVINDVDTIVGDAVGIYDKTMKDLAPSISVAKKAGRKTLPALKKVLPGSMYSKLEDITSERKRNNGGMNTDELAIASSLGDIFKIEQTIGAAQASNDKRERDGDRAIGDARFEANSSLQGNIASGIGRLVGYQDNILSAYQRKSLELQHRHYFAARDLLVHQRAFTADAKTALDVIAKNTGLPNEQKVLLSESFMAQSRERLAGRMQDSITDRLSNVKGNIVKNLKAQIADGVETLNGGLEMAGDMMGEDGEEDDGMGMSATDMAASMGADMVSTSLGAKLGKKLSGVLMKNEKFVAGNEMAQDLSRNKWRHLVNKVQDNDNPVANILGELMGSTNGNGETINNNLKTDAMAPASWDVLSRRSIVEIIPGYLSRILQQVTITASGDANAERMTYSTSKEKFMSVGERKDNAKKQLDKDLGGRLVKDTQEMVQAVDPDGVLPPEAHADMVMQFTLDSNNLRAFDPAYYSNPGSFPTTEYADIIAAHIRRRYSVGRNEEGKFVQTLSKKSSRDIVKSGSSFANLSANLGSMSKLITESMATGEGEVLDDLGLVSDNQMGVRSVDFKAKDALIKEKILEAIMGSEDFSGAHDAGGIIEDGEFGLVGEFGPEIVEGPVDITGREETGGILNGIRSTMSRMGKKQAEILDGIKGKMPNKKNEVVDNFLSDMQSPEYLSDLKESVLSSIERDRANFNKFYADSGINGESLKAGMEDKLKYVKGMADQDYLQQAKDLIAKESEKNKGMFAKMRSKLDDLRGKNDDDDEEETSKKSSKREKTNKAFSAPKGASSEESNVLHQIHLLERIADRLDGGMLVGSVPMPEGGWGSYIAGKGKSLASFVGKGIGAGLSKAGSLAGRGVMAAWSGGINLAGKAAGAGLSLANKGIGGILDGVKAIGDKYEDMGGDIYIKGRFSKPALRKSLMEAGEYFDVKSGKVITSIEDIKGEIKDKAGNIILSDEDYRRGLVATAKTKVKGASSKLVDLAKAGWSMQASILGSVPKLAMRALGEAKKFVERPMDVYIGDETTPRLKAIIFKNGGYYSANSLDVLNTHGDIDGAVLDSDGNEILSDDDIALGLFDSKGLPITGGALSHRLKSLAGGAMGAIKGMANKAKEFGIGTAKAIGRGVAGIGSALTGKMGGIHIGGSETNEWLGAIHAHLLAVFPSKIMQSEHMFMGPVAPERPATIKREAEQAETLTEVLETLETQTELAEEADAEMDATQHRKGGWRSQKAEDDAEDEEEAANSKGGGILGALGGLGGLGAFGKKKKGGKFSKDDEEEDDGEEDILDMAGDFLGDKAGAAATAVGSSLLTTGATSAAAAGTSLLASVGTGLATIGSGLASVAGVLLSAPVLLGAAAAVVVGYGAYKAFQFMDRRKDVTPFERLRFLQYGIDPTDKTQVVTIRYLENELYDAIEVGTTGKVNVDESWEDIWDDYHSEFDLSFDNVDHAERFRQWFYHRFVTVLSQHKLAARLLDIDVDEVDSDLTDKQKGWFLTQVQFTPALAEMGMDPYSVLTSPWVGIPIQSNREEVVNLTAEIRKALKEGTLEEMEVELIDSGDADEKARAAKAKEAGRRVRGDGKRADNKFISMDRIDISSTASDRHSNLKGVDLSIVGTASNGEDGLLVPAAGLINSPFGTRTHPIKGGKKAHGGIDIAAPAGSPVYAARDGIIIRAAYSQSYGNVIYIEHEDKKSTRYAHLSGFAPGIEVGVDVMAGELIGYVGSTGNSTGPHLHFEYRGPGEGLTNNVTKLNPVEYFDSGQAKVADAMINKNIEDAAEVDDEGGFWAGLGGALGFGNDEETGAKTGNVRKGRNKSKAKPADAVAKDVADGKEVVAMAGVSAAAEATDKKDAPESKTIINVPETDMDPVVDATTAVGYTAECQRKEALAATYDLNENILAILEVATGGKEARRLASRAEIDAKYNTERPGPLLMDEEEELVVGASKFRSFPKQT